MDTKWFATTPTGASTAPRSANSCPKTFQPICARTSSTHSVGWRRDVWAHSKATTKLKMAFPVTMRKSLDWRKWIPNWKCCWLSADGRLAHRSSRIWHNRATHDKLSSIRPSISCVNVASMDLTWIGSIQRAATTRKTLFYCWKVSHCCHQYTIRG